MRWYFEGGCNAHSCTLHRLDFRCEGESDDVRMMVHIHTRKTIFVPKHRKLSHKTRRQIIEASGVGRERYTIAWNTRPRSIKCPKLGN